MPEKISTATVAEFQLNIYTAIEKHAGHGNIQQLLATKNDDYIYIVNVVLHSTSLIFHFSQCFIFTH